MTDIINIGLQVALVVLIALLFPCVYRVIVAKNPVERLQAIDQMTSLLVGILIVLVPLQGVSLLIDVALALAAFSFVGAVAVARYLCEGRVF